MPVKKIVNTSLIILCFLVAYVLIGNVFHRYIFPEPEPSVSMYPVSGDIIVNAFAGEKIIFLKTGIETDGAYSLREFHLQPGGAVPRAHIHDYDETFKVMQGKLTLIWNGKTRVLHPVDSLTISAGDAHQPVNNDTTELVTINRVTPAARHDLMLAQTHGFLTERAVPRSKREFFLQAMLFVDYYGTYAAEFPVRVQKILSFLMAPTARLAGYKTWNPEYSMKWKKDL